MAITPIDNLDSLSDVRTKLNQLIDAYNKPSINSIADAGTFALADANNVVQYNSATAGTATVPPNSSVAFPVGTAIEVHQIGAGELTIAAGSGVTLNSRNGTDTAGQYAIAVLRKTATDTWVLGGDVA